jgi:hypothetical protein
MSFQDLLSSFSPNDIVMVSSDSIFPQRFAQRSFVTNRAPTALPVTPAIITTTVVTTTVVTTTVVVCGCGAETV